MYTLNFWKVGIEILGGELYSYIPFNHSSKLLILTLLLINDRDTILLPVAVTNSVSHVIMTMEI